MGKRGIVWVGRQAAFSEAQSTGGKTSGVGLAGEIDVARSEGWRRAKCAAV